MNPASSHPTSNLLPERTLNLARPTGPEPVADMSDWEQRMAKLVGLSGEEGPENSRLATPLVSDSSEDFIDPKSLSLENPPASRTAEPLSANPLAKLGLVGTATLAIVLLAGVFLSQIMGGGHHTVSKNLPVAAPSATPKNESQILSAEIETLKTKLALAEQSKAVKQAYEMLRRAPIKTSAVVRMPAPSQSTAVRTVYVPRIITVEKIVKVPQIVSSSDPRMIAAEKIAKVPQIVSSNPTPTSRLTTPPTLPPRSPSAPAQTDLVGQSAPVPTMPTSETTTSPSLLPQTETKSPSTVAAGVTAKAVLATAVFGETIQSANNQADDDKNIFVVRLQEPLKSVDGAIALPANTELLTEIRSLSEQGLIQLKVIKGVIQEKGNIKEINLPANAMIVRAPEGQPLIANQYPNQESTITGMDMGLFFLGGLGKVAELMNRTESQVITTSAAGSIVSNANPKSNVWAGLLEGGSNTVVPQIAQRNQQAISQMMQRTNIWFIAAGTEVEVYVNQLLQL